MVADKTDKKRWNDKMYARLVKSNTEGILDEKGWPWTPSASLLLDRCTVILEDANDC